MVLSLIYLQQVLVLQLEAEDLLPDSVSEIDAERLPCEETEGKKSAN